MLPLVGFLPADDPRVLAAINATEERLTDDRGLVFRYRSRDSLAGEEGTFVLCTFWLAQALARAGQPARARIVFERAAAFVNDVGLLAEEVDPVSGELLGNFPQPSATSGSSTRPGPFLRSNSERPHLLKLPRAPRVTRTPWQVRRVRRGLQRARNR
jgi:GH15 family glucan-1,4-alpha-glucosidase